MPQTANLEKSKSQIPSTDAPKGRSYGELVQLHLNMYAIESSFNEVGEVGEVEEVGFGIPTSAEGSLTISGRKGSTKNSLTSTATITSHP